MLDQSATDRLDDRTAKLDHMVAKFRAGDFDNLGRWISDYLQICDECLAAAGWNRDAFCPQIGSYDAVECINTLLNMLGDDGGYCPEIAALVRRYAFDAGRDKLIALGAAS